MRSFLRRVRRVMKNDKFRMKLGSLAALALFLVAGCLLIPDDKPTGERVENRAPRVNITAGAATADSAGVDYKVHFQWRGSDDDGVVIRFQYAIDDTISESAWHDTTGFNALLKFEASHPNTYADDGTFTDWHTFYIRAVDNEYATSAIDKRFFNAKTIAPTATITFPKLPSGSTSSLVKTFVVEWKGEDLDSSQPDQTPRYFEYKMIRLKSAFITPEAIVDSLLTRQNTFLDTLQTGDRTAWIRVGGDVLQRTLRDLPETGGEIFVFGVRAIDEAGATEPVLEEGLNWFRFHVTATPSQPYVTVLERSLGRHKFPSDGPIWNVEVPTNTEIRFRWVGDADYYGGKPGNVNYGLDVPDPQDDRYRDPQGIGGWIGWGKWDKMVNPLIFDDTEDGQTHVLYIRMRDTSDLRSSEQLCTIVIRVVAFRFARTALLVDDARVLYGLNGTNQDQVHDAFIDRFIGRIRAYAPDGLDKRSMYRPRGNAPEAMPPTDNEALKLSEMAQYSALLWSFNFTTGDRSGIWMHEHEAATGGDRRLLSSYLAAGGKLFLFGGRSLSAILSPIGVPGGDYPKLPPQAGISDQDFSDTSFLYRFLHIRSQIVGLDQFRCSLTIELEHQSWRDGLIRCVSTNPAYPDLYIDPAKHDTEALADCGPNSPPTGGIRDFEGVLFDRAYSPFFPEAGLDTLYTSVGYNWGGFPPTTWDGSVIAQRYESTAADTLRGQQQGRVVLFLFQPYPFQEGPAADAGTSAINWLMTGQDY
ncbi:MAG: hypothetical protein ACE15D_01690 [Candidatus Eisenbacteria bacterium]